MSLPQTVPSMLSLSELQRNWPEFEAKILSLLTKLHLKDLNFFCDHVALRVNSIASADALRAEFSQIGKIISDNQINGRSILIIELNTPLKLGAFSIECVELPYPGDTVYPQEGWEHIELVLPSAARDCERLTEELLQRCPALFPLLSNLTAKPEEFSDIKVKLSSPKGDKERLANPTIAFKGPDVCIKVHPHGIKDVIASEQ
ncbi:VOC family protein [Shewanella acanthi]|uniref:VOC family protein n=1 Tax=Shewanella acanthi TaxID=2864212 RepID=UPI001C65B44A|nr:VOC family protein [Shewanella acanthi]QYJ77519.1 VOC family protein [Shewanella acanthi]